ncbi:hypothetical protein C8F04DRAFT_1397086 [Mycena alexandri]|uniref:Uncharacterized protein n=1 Tax=Mycena alexandri TaxID=1745969 RepID=A0AAD6SPJ7_9AGAR|nr:hypothetical protein C8F04DRAFT_1397086 [Mycena alexandri]
MHDITSQILSLASVVLIPFIPNDILRNMMLALVPLFFVGRLFHHNTPHRCIERLDASMEDIARLFNRAVEECTRDPRFICETGLKLTERESFIFFFSIVVDGTPFRIKYALSTLCARTISTKYIPWKIYPYQFITIAWAINDCRRDMEELRSSILLALEHARQQVFQEDIVHRKTTLATVFPGAVFDAASILDENKESIERAIVPEASNDQGISSVFDTSTSSV